MSPPLKSRTLHFPPRILHSYPSRTVIIRGCLSAAMILVLRVALALPQRHRYMMQPTRRAETRILHVTQNPDGKTLA